MSTGHFHFGSQLPEDFRIRTERLDLIPSGSQLADTQSHEHTRLSQLLGARIPNDWPPEMVVDRSSPEGAGWWNWYIVERQTDDKVLIGTAGVKGWPSLSGSVQAGCAFLPQFQWQGYGTEAVRGLTSWLLSQPQIDRVIADVPAANESSIRIVRKLGFDLSSSNDELLRFEKPKT